MGRVILLSISRFLPTAAHKCTQKIVFSHTIQFPCFLDNTSDFIHCQYKICGFVYHVGATPYSGHYRASVRCNNQWLIYDDGKLPDKRVDLPDEVLRNTVLFWLLPVDGITVLPDRNADELLVLRYRNISGADEDMDAGT